jgi:hypothetical protein
MTDKCFDETFFTTLYHGLPNEYSRTIQDNIALLHEGENILGNIGSALSFASIFTGPVSTAGASMINKVFDDLDETGKQRLNDKVRVIAQNKESVELIKEMFGSKGQTPHIIMLNELVKRHQEEIALLSNKYDKNTVQTIYNNIMIDNDVKQELNEIHKGISKLSRWNQSSDNDKYSRNTSHDFKDTFNFLAQVGTATKCDDLVETASIAMTSMSIYDSVNALSSALASGGSIFGILNPITSLLCAGMGLFNMFKKKKSGDSKHIQIIIKHLEQLSKQLQNIHKDIREQFSNVFKYLDNITNKLNKQYMISLNVYYKIEHIEKSIGNLSIICEYYGKQNLLQDLFLTINKITKGTPDYFKNLGKSGFNEMFMDLFYWLDNHSFDQGTNGYIHSTSGNIVANLNTSIHNRIGYLSSLLNYPYAKQMANHTIFNICVDALEILIHNALPYYGTIPMPYDNVVPVMNKANLTEQFIEYSRQPQLLENLLASYNKTVDQLRYDLLQWVDASRHKIGYNVHDASLDAMISSTPISTGVRYARDINKCWKDIPMKLTSKSNAILQTYKLCEVARKFGLGDYDFRFSLSRGKIAVDITIYIGFTLNGTYFDISIEQWHHPDGGRGCGKLSTGENVLYCWAHNYNSPGWIIQNYTQTNIVFEQIIRKACEDKLTNVRQEMSNISYTIGYQVNTLCDKIQEQYTVINKVFELNDSKLDNLNSGVWIKTRLDQLIHQQNTYGYTVISFCDFVKEKANQVNQLKYNTSQISTSIRNSINKLNALSSDVVRYQHEYKYIINTQSNIETMYKKLVDDEKMLIEKKKDETMTKNITQIGIEIGRKMTLNMIVNKLEQTHKNDEVKALKSRFANELNCSEVHLIDTDISSLFRSSFCNGSSMVLLEASMALQEYPGTVSEIQMLAYKSLQRILTSHGSISYTIDLLLDLK